jgi:leucyl aminopeptidase
MRIQRVTQPPTEVKSDWLILGLFEEEAGLPGGIEGTGVAATIERLRSAKDVRGTLGELTVLHEPSGVAAGAVLLVGLGPRSRFDAGAAFTAAVAATKRLAGKARENVALVLPDVDDVPAADAAITTSEGMPVLVLPRVEDLSAVASAMVEGAVVGTRGPGLHLSEPNRHPFGSLMVVVPDDEEDPATAASIEAALRRGEIIGQAVNFARDLANTPPVEKSPVKLADRIRLVAEDAGLAVELWDAERIEQERFGGLMGVAAGSEQPPRFVVLRYARGGDSPTLALVGKGVTFDSGGLSIKPTASMEDMKADMTGAAVVAASMQAVARLGLPVNIAGYLPLTENMTGGRAMKLGDVLTMRNGKTVEVLNTDAEGRLILADALSYAVEQKPARLIDLATLTGACVVALGTRIAGLFSNDEAFGQEVLDAARHAGERAWTMPLDDEFKEGLKSQVADLKNIGGKWGGAATAAKFLENFVGSTPWVHLDIAGPSWSESESPARDAGATGCFVRTLVRFIERAATS